MRWPLVALLVLVCAEISLVGVAADGNRLAYLDGPLDPYYPHREFPKLITPQWVGEEGVECVVTLAIDDMRESVKYEAFLRPILNRLKQIDGRAAVSIMSCRVDPKDPQLQAWLKEGLSIEVHTYDHPCPLLQDGGLLKAKETYDKCVDLMNEIPGNKPVAFRVPCCDSKNTPSPRFWAEIFNKTTAKGNFLQIDSSVFNIITSKDKELPKEITESPDGSERFRRYVPFANFVNTIEDYPYPYIIGGMCWEFPCVVPSDWSAQHVQKPNNPDTVRDWKLALDACVLKKGTFNLVFHPHGWIRNDQIIELIDHAVAKHGKKVKFLTFKECAERLNRNLLLKNPLRDGDGTFRGTLLIDREKLDGLLDVEFEAGLNLVARTWDAGVGAWKAIERENALPALPLRANPPVYTHLKGFLHRDIDGDGTAELIGPLSGPLSVEVWTNLRKPDLIPIAVPHSDLLKDQGTAFRFIDINADGKLDCLFSNHERYCLYLFKDMKEGWATKVFDVVRDKEHGPERVSNTPVIPPFVRADGTNNGAWFHSGALWLQNEDTWRLPDNVFKLTFAEMLEGSGFGVQGSGGNRGQETGDRKQERGDRGQKAVDRKQGTGDRKQETGDREQGPECCGGAEAETSEPASAGLLPSAPGFSPGSKHAQTKPLAGFSRLPSPGFSQLQTQFQIPNPKSQVPNLLRRATQYIAQLAGPSFDELEMTPPLSPEESLKAMHVRPGMKIELVAAEPLVVDPVAFDWGPDGRLWVVEMRDYPNGITWKKEGDEREVPGGRVKVLTDTNGDGRYDKAAVFLDKIPFPTGVKVWRKGILVTAAPEILYAEDKDGDDQADEKIVLYRGFGEGNQQHRVNGLRWGLDNWLHVGNGDSGGVIRSLSRVGVSPARAAGDGGQGTGNRGQGTGAGLATSHQPLATDGTRSVPTTSPTEVNVAGRDLRIRPDTGELDATSGNTQFGRERDDWGNWFGGNNSNPMWHYTLDDFYLRRNSHLTPPAIRKQVSVFPGTAPVFPTSKTIARFNDFSMANRFTSACSEIIYRDDLLGGDYYGNSFVCEPVHNLVHREIVEPQGSTFTSKRAADEQKSEFLASDDSWFRPSMCRTGPDGALWVADMYRFVIEHPKWIPPAAQKKLELRAGDDKGRIYRIYPEGQQPRPIVRLDTLDTAGLVAALDSPNGPQRDLAHQMLLWRGDKAAIAPLRALAAKAARPQTRLQALCTLDGLETLAEEPLLPALADQHPGVRRHAVRLAEPRLATSAKLAEATLKLAGDSDPQVRMQVAYSLGAWNDPRAAAALATLATTSDVYQTAAALSSVSKENVADVLAAILATGSSATGEKVLAMAAAMGADAAVGKALANVVRPAADGRHADWQFRSLVAASDALLRRKVQVASLLDAAGQNDLRQMLDQARETAASDQPAATLAMTLLARGLDASDDADVALLASRLAPQRSPEVKAAAVTALGRSGRKNIAELLLSGWASHSPPLRSQILDVLASREDWSLSLLSAVESGQVSQAQFDARRRQQFANARSRPVRERAEKVLLGAIDANRQKLVETYLPAAAGSGGDPARGKAVYAKRCANCHKLEGAGFAVGPDLAPLATRSADYLLTQILDPNRAFEDRYLEYLVLTADGRQLTGMLLEETGASLTLAAPEGKQATIARSEIEQIKSSGKSLMPEGIEKDVSPAEMADLVAYVRASRLPPRELPGNQPQVVTPFNADGSLRLLATNARVYGPTIKMEETFRALGWWNSEADHCVWTFDVPAGSEGAYRMTVDYSCADNSAGNTVVLEVAGQRLAAKVESSGGWETYRGWNLGTVKLPAGQSELVVRSDGPIKNALFDLRGVRLVPTR